MSPAASRFVLRPAAFAGSDVVSSAALAGDIDAVPGVAPARGK